MLRETSRSVSSPRRSCTNLARVCFLNFILHRNVIYFICKLVHVCIYVHKLCEDMFGGCKTLFSWLGQKVNKKIDALWQRDDTVSWQDIPIPFSLQYSNRIWSHWIFEFNFEILRIFDLNEILDLSIPHFFSRQIGGNMHLLFRQTVHKLVYGEWRRP